MKKLLALVLALCMVFALCACGSTTAPAATAAPAATEAPATEAPAADPSAKGEGVLTYDEYLAAELDTQVVIETYVQNTQTWWDGKASFYTQDESGAYFIYNMPCTEEEYAAISVPGTKLRVTGYKSEWAGELEIIDATFEVLEGSYIAEAVNVTEALPELEAYMNQLVSFDGMVVTMISFKNGAPGDDIYVTMSKGGVSYEFCVEAYCATTQPDSELYAAVSAVQVGDVVDVTGYLYWYNGADTHIQAITVLDNINAKSEGVMSYEEYTAAEIDSQVVIETYVQNTQTWWDGKASFYTQDGNGGYFLYNMPCTEEEYVAISVPGTKLRVTGYKSEWAGEVEIVDATFEVLEGSYLAAPVNVSWSLDALESYMNQLVKFDDMTVEAISFKNGEPGDDIYVTLSKDGVSYEFCVEAYCATTQPNSDVYAAVSEMQVGDLVTVTAFLYWYNGADAHIQTVLFG